MRSVAEDAAVRQLRRVIEIRQKQLDQAKLANSKGMVSDSDVNGAEAALIEANAKLAQRQDEVVAAKIGDTVPAMSRELIEITVSQAESDAKLEYIAKRLEGLSQTMEGAAALAKIEEAEKSAEKSLNEVEIARHQIELNQPPTTEPGGL